MADACCDLQPSGDPRARKALWIALVLNAIMFIVEVVYSFLSNSVALKADALDFLGDAANYGVSLYVLSLSVIMRARASQIKGLTMGIFGLYVIADALYAALFGGIPKPEIMGIIALLALVVNVSVALMLYNFRSGDSNMQSVWLCSRNDALGNLAVIAAAGGVHVSQTVWPDIFVAAIISYLSISSSLKVLRLAKQEIRHVKSQAH